MLELNAWRRQEVLDYLDMRFGIPASLFDRARFTESAAGEVWVSSETIADALIAHRPPGLRALRRTPTGLKPTSAFLVSIGSAVTRSVVPVDEPSLRLLLLGRRLPCSAETGYIALSHGGDILGCGFVADALMHCLIPTGRRRELLDILGVGTAPEGPEV